MQRRKFLIGTASTALGASALVGTGAFDLVRANRDFDVEVVGDEKAYLGLKATSKYAESEGKLSLDFAGGTEEQNGKGLNKKADSRFDNVFKITNNGTQTVSIRLVDEEDGISRWDKDLPGFYWSEDETPCYDGDHDFGDGAVPVLEPGDSVYVSIVFWGLAASDPAGRYEKTDMSKAEDQDFIGLYADASDA